MLAFCILLSLLCRRKYQVVDIKCLQCDIIHSCHDACRMYTPACLNNVRLQASCSCVIVIPPDAGTVRTCKPSPHGSYLHNLLPV
jgi:hypothetical protein